MSRLYSGSGSSLQGLSTAGWGVWGGRGDTPVVRTFSLKRTSLLYYGITTAPRRQRRKTGRPNESPMPISCRHRSSPARSIPPRPRKSLPPFLKKQYPQAPKRTSPVCPLSLCLSFRGRLVWPFPSSEGQGTRPPVWHPADSTAGVPVLPLRAARPATSTQAHPPCLLQPWRSQMRAKYCTSGRLGPRYPPDHRASSNHSS